MLFLVSYFLWHDSIEICVFECVSKTKKPMFKFKSILLFFVEMSLSNVTVMKTPFFAIALERYKSVHYFALRLSFSWSLITILQVPIATMIIRCLQVLAWNPCIVLSTTGRIVSQCLFVYLFITSLIVNKRVTFKNYGNRTFRRHGELSADEVKVHRINSIISLSMH